jgi:hypothetical protein
MPKEFPTAVPNYPVPGRWGQRLRVCLAVAVFLAAVALVIASITTI